MLVVGIGTNDKLKSRLVRAATGSWCSHSWIEFSSTEHGIWAVHAQPEGVVREGVIDVVKAYPKHRRFEVVGVPLELELSAIGNALAALGTPYDWGVIINAVKLVRWRLTGRTSRLHRNPREFHCSEFVSMVIRDLGIPKSEQLDPEAVHPGKVFNFMVGHRSFREFD